MSDSKDPAYLAQFCPILSHAVLAPPQPKAKPSILAGMATTGGGASLRDDALEPDAPEAEYIGCQGPACAFFLEGEGRCGIPLIAMGIAAMLFRFGGMPPTSPTSQH